MFTKSKRTLTLVAITTAACLCCLTLTLALAGKPDKPGGGKGGGGKGPPPAGTVYFTISGQMHSMNPDGTAKTPLPILGDAEPSKTLHGGHRWFLLLRKIEGHFYPDGDPRYEIFAVRDDGNEDFTVQLTNQPDLEPFTRSRPDTPGRWAVDGNVIDALVSWPALRWDLATGEPIGGGIYDAEIIFDGSGNVQGLVAQPTLPLVGAGHYAFDADGDGDADEFYPGVQSFDWSPDGTAIVWAGFDAQGLLGLLISDQLSGPVISTPFVGDGLMPDWSPDGAKIVFESREGIETINVDGTGRSLILEDWVSKGNATSFVQLFAPTWSPTGSHFVYWHMRSKTGVFSNNVYRAAANGSGDTDLTKDTDAFSRPIAWR